MDEQVKFMIETTETLSRIEANQERNIKDVANLCAICNKIPPIETSLNNHLHTHDNITRYILYPTGVAVILAVLGVFAKIVLRVF